MKNKNLLITIFSLILVITACNDTTEISTKTSESTEISIENISTGYLQLSKTSSIGTAENFEYQLYGNYNGVDTLFATGISDENGIVNWTYEIEYKSAESKENLYGETNEIIELPIYDDNGLVSYEIREIIDTSRVGSSKLPFISETPVGWTKSTDDSYFFIDNITLD